MTASACSTTQSRICALSSFALPLVGFFLCLLPVACGDKHEEAAPAERDYAFEIHSCSTRLKTVKDRREAHQQHVLLANTAVGGLLTRLAQSEVAGANSIRVLTEYHKKARDQGIPDTVQFDKNGKPLEQLSLRITALETTLDTVDSWLADGGNQLAETWTRLIHTNVISKSFVEAGIADVERLALLRDHSARLNDARRYWTDELANAMRGAETDPKMIRLALGTQESLKEEISEIFALYTRADTERQTLLKSSGAIGQRLEWASKTLDRAAAEDAWRKKAAHLLTGFRKDAGAFSRESTAASLTVLDRSADARKRREQALKDGTRLLDRINKVFVVEAQKRGWPLPVRP